MGSRRCPTLLIRLLVIALGLAGGIAPTHAQDTGQGNGAAAATARQSPLVASARHDLHVLAVHLRDPALRRATVDAIENPATCIRHRAGLDVAAAHAIIDRLVAARLLGDPAALPDAAAPSRLIAAVFPPVDDAGSACPHLPQPFYASPGGDAAGHHNWPGGLAVHTAFNARIARALAQGYDHQTRLISDHDAVIAAALWHDWAKAIVFQWHADGSEFPEASIGGQGVTDNNGLPGDSRTGAHHILGLAEAMARGLAPTHVLIQACAHAAPVNGQAWKLVNWLRAAAIIARIDPVRRGYLMADAQGGLTLPAAPGGGWRVECLIHFQSDQNWVMAESAARLADDLLARLAGQFGYDRGDDARYRTAYRNVVLSQLGADRIQLRNQRGGLAAVAADLRRLRRRGLI